MYQELTTDLNFKEEQNSEVEIDLDLNIRQRGQRTNRPRHKMGILQKGRKTSKCKQVLDDLLHAMKPLETQPLPDTEYWFFGKHVTERLNAMRPIDAEAASTIIINLLNGWQSTEPT